MMQSLVRFYKTKSRTIAPLHVAWNARSSDVRFVDGCRARFKAVLYLSNRVSLQQWYLQHPECLLGGKKHQSSVFSR